MRSALFEAPMQEEQLAKSSGDFLSNPTPPMNLNAALAGAPEVPGWAQPATAPTELTETALLASGGSFQVGTKKTEGVLGSEPAKQADLLQRTNAAPLQATWRVGDLRAAIAQVTEWVRARQGIVTATDDRHFDIWLAASEAAPFLQQFSSPPAERQQLTDEIATTALSGREQGQTRVASPEPASSASPASPPPWVVISLELVPSE